MGREKNGRLNLRLDLPLLSGIKTYAERRGLTVTRLVEMHFREVLEAEALQANPPIDAEQV